MCKLVFIFSFGLVVLFLWCVYVCVCVGVGLQLYTPKTDRLGRPIGLGIAFAFVLCKAQSDCLIKGSKLSGEGSF